MHDIPYSISFTYIQRGADKSLALPTSHVIEWNQWCRWIEGLFVCQTASLFFLQRLKGSMSGNAQFQQHQEDTSCNQVFFPARQGAEGNSHQF
jgi:hypothetical protein